MRKIVLSPLFAGMLVLGLVECASSQVKKNEQHTGAQIDSIKEQIKLRYKQHKNGVDNVSQKKMSPKEVIFSNSGVPLNDEERAAFLGTGKREVARAAADTTISPGKIISKPWVPQDNDVHKKVDDENVKNVARKQGKVISKSEDRSGRAASNKRWSKN